VEKLRATPLQFAKYESLPHLFAIRASLLWFVNNERLALQIMQDASNKVKFKDLQLPYLRSVLMYYQYDHADRFISILEDMRSTARYQENTVHERNDQCAPRCSKDELRWGPNVISRAHRWNNRAVNLAAYAIAEDLAEDLKPAEALLPIAEEHAKKLIEAADQPENILARQEFLDTAALVIMVSEARKSTRDLNRIRDAVAIFEKSLVLEEERLSALSIRSKGDFRDIKLVRSHLVTARELLE
jgi:hypothetical protein